MQIQLLKKYKSLVPPIEIVLPDFTILTGINGVGKTHLLTGLLEYKFSVKDNDRDLIESNFFDCLYVPAENLVPKERHRFSTKELDERLKELWKIYETYLEANKKESTNLERYFRQTFDKWDVEEIAKRAGKKIDSLTYNDFTNHYPVDVTNYNPFIHAFSFHFKLYYDKWENNQYRQYLNLQKGMVDVDYISDDEFQETHGEKPWIFLNIILKEAKFNYRLTYPLNIQREQDFEIELVDTIDGNLIKIDDLSSGEKILMSLALAVYNASTGGRFPKVLLLDEPDAFLHPSMIKSFLDVIENVFIKEKNIKVIITTHSPSTVGLCEESSLFIMNKTGNRIEKATKDKALKVLTAGVPALSINYENRRQVFVESKYDVFFYDRIYDKIKNKLITDISLNFIAAGVDGSGNCDQVKNIVKLLTGYGNKFIFGIIDWDTKNVSSNYIKVLGQGKRYSIENYIFDPIILCAFLLREKIIERLDWGLSENETYIDLKFFDNLRLQSLSDLLITKIKSNTIETNSQKQIVSYLNDKKIEVPLWYLHHQGHELEVLLKETFSPLKKYKGEGDLKKEIINKVMDDLPEFISIDIYNTFKEIQES
jgi:energy-coupling factor transporter ATP-binding protein EcfA2